MLQLINSSAVKSTRRYEEALKAYSADGDSSADQSVLSEIVRYFIPTCVFGSSSSLQFHVVVSDRPSARMRWKVSDRTVDVRVCDLTSLRKHLREGNPQTASAFAGRRFVYGDKALAAELQNAARDVIAKSVKRSTTLDFSLRTRPFDLLREFKIARVSDPSAAGLIRAQLIAVCCEAYCALNGVATESPSVLLAMLSTHNRSAADMLKYVVEAPLSSLCREPKSLEDFVKAFAGEERFDRELNH